MLTLDASAPSDSSPSDDPVDKYLPEPQSFKAVLKLDDDIRSSWLHAIKMENKNLIDHKTFILGAKPRKDELIIPVKFVLKANKQPQENLTNSKLALLHAVTWKREESRKQKPSTKNSSFNKDKKPLNKPKQTPSQLISHNN
jgi:hypothetical protein